jgi:predicted AlkP superfamily pyrophosphatase or phosphodiesterase
MSIIASRLVHLIVLFSIPMACSRLPVVNIDPHRFAGQLERYPIEHVVIFAIDGLKQDTLWNYLLHSEKQPGGLHDLLGADTSNGHLQFTKAIAAQQGVTVFPSYTYPAWTSAFTGVYPGAHGITGNSVFFRNRGVVRYYTDFHADAVKVQLERDMLAYDINPRTKTLYQYLDERGGQSIVVHNMVVEGSERGRGVRKPSFDTLWSYQRNQSLAVDENTLWESVQSLKDFNRDNPGPLRLPTAMTIYFSGLDHAEHLYPDDPERGRLEYLNQLDRLIAKFLRGASSIPRHHYPVPTAEQAVERDVLQWEGLEQAEIFQRTLFVVLSDHGHTPIDWNTAVGIEDLRLMFEELSHRRKRAYHVETPVLINESWWSKVRAAMGLFKSDTVSRKTDVVATLNGGALGLHLKPPNDEWDHRPDFSTDIVPVLEHILLTLHKNRLGPQAVFYNTGDRYVLIPYRYDQTAITLLPAQPITENTFSPSEYPLAIERLEGLARQLPSDPMSAPDLIFLADRSRQLTFVNHQDDRVLDGLDLRTRRHFHADHGHLNGADSFVPILFRVGGYTGDRPLSMICQARVSDLTPTVLDVLGLQDMFDTALRDYPVQMKGKSLKSLAAKVLAEKGGNSDLPCPTNP